jgi:hypothetical protein
MNLILQDRHYRLLDEYITEGDDYVDWLQWAAAKELKKLKGVSVTMPMLNPVHLDHENMQQVVPSIDERWDNIEAGSNLTKLSMNTKLRSYGFCWKILRMFLLSIKGSLGVAQ